jgi:hypothetical protein
MSNSWRLLPAVGCFSAYDCALVAHRRLLRPNPNPSMFREMLTDNRSSHHFAEAFLQGLRIADARPVRERKFRLGPDFCNTAPKLCQHD